jgi:hypothetical protein
VQRAHGVPIDGGLLVPSVLCGRAAAALGSKPDWPSPPSCLPPADGAVSGRALGTLRGDCARCRGAGSRGEEPRGDGLGAPPAGAASRVLLFFEV